MIEYSTHSNDGNGLKTERSRVQARNRYPERERGTQNLCATSPTMIDQSEHVEVCNLINCMIYGEPFMSLKRNPNVEK